MHHNRECSLSRLIMKEIVLKDKIITITQDTLEVKRLSGKWVQSFFEIFLIKVVLGTFIITSIFMYFMYFLLSNQGAITTSHYIPFISGGGFILIVHFIGYYKNKTIPINKIMYGDINKLNQLVITYSDRKGHLNQMINLPKNPSERENVINQLLEEKLIDNDIPELPVDSEKKMHRNNLYIGIIGTLVCLALHFALLNISTSSFVMVFNSIMFLFSITAIIYSANRLLRMKNTHSPIRRNYL